MKKYGLVYLKVAVYFETDLTEEEIDDIVTEEVDYSFNHKLIASAEIKDIEL